jgi:hypothetical protein
MLDTTPVPEYFGGQRYSINKTDMKATFFSEWSQQAEPYQGLRPLKSANCKRRPNMEEQMLAQNWRLVFLCLLLVPGFGCSGDGGGGLNLDQVQGIRQSQTLAIQIDGSIAALELHLPFDPARTITSTISVAVDQEAIPERTYMDYTVIQAERKLRVAILNGQEKGLNGQDFSLILSYLVFDNNPNAKLFEDVNVVEALDTNFHKRQIGWGWTK